MDARLSRVGTGSSSFRTMKQSEAFGSRRLGTVVVLLALLAAACTREQGPEGTQGESRSGSAKVDPAQVFQRRCARCHGPTGRGNGQLAATLSPRPRDLTKPEHLSQRTDEQLFRIIAKGGRAGGLSAAMPGYEGFLSNAEIEGLVKHLRHLSGQGSGQKP